ncbi:MAG: molybdenum cofactor guanylyltransferase [Caulobacteraceae bacterium]
MSDGPRRAAPTRIAGLVLAGGRSSRFGAEKAVATLAGRPLLAWNLAALEGASETVAVSAALGSETAALARSLGRAVVGDDPGHAKGPLAGLAAGLAWASGAGFDLLISLPCDMPLVGTRQVEALIGALDGARAAHATTSDGPQPLCAVWRVDLADRLAARLAAGDHPPVKAFLAEIGAIPVAFADPLAFRNANTLKALAAIEAELERGDACLRSPLA